MISDEDVKKIGRLAHLALGPEEVTRYGREINAILSYVEQLQQINVSNVEPMTHVVYRTAEGATVVQNNVFREDRADPSMPVELALQNAPDRNGTFFRVPLIKEQGEH